MLYSNGGKLSGRAHLSGKFSELFENFAQIFFNYHNVYPSLSSFFEENLRTISVQPLRILQFQHFVELQINFARFFQNLPAFQLFLPDFNNFLLGQNFSCLPPSYNYVGRHH